MKKITYSVYQKLIATMMSIVISCEPTNDINEKFGGEKLALNMFDMDTLPDQSQINELTRWFDSDSIKQLQDIHHNLFMEILSHTQVVVDCNQTGLIANGKTFELAENNGVRHIIVQTLSTKGKLKYSLLITNIRNLRTSKFYGICFLWLVFITYTLISWFKSTIPYETELENVRVRVLVKIFGN